MAKTAERKKFICEDCGAEFNFKASLRRHRTRECPGRSPETSAPTLNSTPEQASNQTVEDTIDALPTYEYDATLAVTPLPPDSSSSNSLSNSISAICVLLWEFLEFTADLTHHYFQKSKVLIPKLVSAVVMLCFTAGLVWAGCLLSENIPNRHNQEPYSTLMADQAIQIWSSPQANPSPNIPPIKKRATTDSGSIRLGPASTLKKYFTLLQNQDYRRAYALLSPEWAENLSYQKFIAGYQGTQHAGTRLLSVKQLAVGWSRVELVIKVKEHGRLRRYLGTYHLVEAGGRWWLESGQLTRLPQS